MLIALRVRGTPERVFGAFTAEIGQWWQPNDLFAFDTSRSGTLAFEPGLGGRLVERYADGTEFEIGRIRRWDPPERLVVSWRQASFDEGQETELHVRFDDVGEGQTRVTVEHFGWGGIPIVHEARHGFPLGAFQRRVGEWWQRLLTDLDAHIASDR